MNEDTSVYQYYDSCDVLLYVGITSRGQTRNIEHYRSKEWWPYVARQTVSHYATRAEAEVVEQQTIRAARPPFNNQHNPDHHVRSRAYMDFAPKPEICSGSVHVCAVCEKLIDRGQAAGWVSWLELVAVQRYNRSSVRNVDMLQSRAALGGLSFTDSTPVADIKDVLNLVIESETAAAAARAIARLTDGDAMHCDQFLDLHIKDLVKTRRDQIKARDIGHTDIREAKWNLAHRTCVEGMQDGEVLVELLPPSPSASWAAWVTTCLHEWREHTDWHTFLERYKCAHASRAPSPAPTPTCSARRAASSRKRGCRCESHPGDVEHWPTVPQPTRAVRRRRQRDTDDEDPD